MEKFAQITKSISLEKYGIKNVHDIVYNPSFEFLYNEELKPSLEGFEKGKLTELGAVNVMTGIFTGRSPKDKYIVDEPTTRGKIEWGHVNRPISEEAFSNLYQKVIRYLEEQDEIFVFKGFAGADKKQRLPIQVINELAWHNLNCR